MIKLHRDINDADRFVHFWDSFIKNELIYSAKKTHFDRKLYGVIHRKSVTGFKKQLKLSYQDFLSWLNKAYEITTIKDEFCVYIEQINKKISFVDLINNPFLFAEALICSFFYYDHLKNEKEYKEFIKCLDNKLKNGWKNYPKY